MQYREQDLPCNILGSVNGQFARTCNPFYSPILYAFVALSVPFTTFEYTLHPAIQISGQS